MYSNILSGTVYGMEGCLIRVEVDISSGLPTFIMVGSLSSETKESAERVRIALKNNDISLPPAHISVNLSPADIRKEGTAFDLPIAIAVLRAMKRLTQADLSNMLMLGELGLNGEIRPVRGVLPIVKKAKEQGITTCLVPKENAQEAAMIEGVRIHAVSSLSSVIQALMLPAKERERLLPVYSEALPPRPTAEELDFSEIAGQESVKRAAVIAAAGFHNLLIIGSPGSGKTMIAKRLPSILPPLSKEESLEVAAIYSVAGILDEKHLFSKKRPFLHPHHTITVNALTGGGTSPRPGIISLSHRGVLFLDELPEFKRQTLDLLRQPLEDRTVQISRVYGTFSYPADFMLVGAMNPCPCGYYPDRNKCQCTSFEIHQYVSHISGPILDRIDLCAESARQDFQAFKPSSSGSSSKQLLEQVLLARSWQKERYQNTAIRFNSDLTPSQLLKYCPLTQDAEHFLEQLFQKLDLSARAYHKILRVSRTIADVEQSPEILKEHLAEAACYYSMGKKVFYDGV